MQQYVQLTKRERHAYWSTLRAGRDSSEATTALAYAFHKASLAHALAYERCEHDEPSFIAPGDTREAYNPDDHSLMVRGAVARYDLVTVAHESAHAIATIAAENL